MTLLMYDFTGMKFSWLCWLVASDINIHFERATVTHQKNDRISS